MDRYLVVASKNNSTISTSTRTFSNENDMQKYIELKTNAGMECHVFNYAKTFKTESRITETQV